VLNKEADQDGSDPALEIKAPRREEASLKNHGAADIEDLGQDVAYQDTLALLQEEIARLEEELRLRDETIALLLEEIRLAEEAEAAGRAEWEQLNQWIGQVEQRVDSREEQDSHLAQELAAERRKADELRLATETERRASEKKGKSLEEEVERLRSKLLTVAKQTDSNAEVALAALENENRRLRRACDDLTRAAASAGEVQPVKAELASARTKLDAAEVTLRGLEDDIARERKEHEAALAALRSQMAREPLQRREGSADSAAASAPGPAPARDLSLVTADERMMAFRQHLQEVHQREVEERSQKRISARISRLWNRTGPPR
jgi:chromosome segregation ATPase